MSAQWKIQSKRKHVSSHSDDDDLKSSVTFVDESHQQKRARVAFNYLERLNRSARSNTSGCSSAFRCEEFQKPFIIICKEGKSPPTTLAVSSKGSYLYSTNNKGALIKWSLEKREKVASLPFIKRNKINHVAISFDDRFVAISDCNGNIQIWTADVIKRIKVLPGHATAVTNLMFHRTAHILYSTGFDKVVNIWCLKKMCLVQTLKAHSAPIVAIDTLNSDTIITGGCDDKVIVWKVPEQKHVVYSEHTSAILAVKFIKEEYFVSGDMRGKLAVWNLYHRHSLCSMNEAHGCNKSNQGFAIFSITYVEDEDLIATGSNSEYLMLWKFSVEQKKIFCAHKVKILGFVNDLITTRCGSCLIAAVGKESSYHCSRTESNCGAKNCIFVMPVGMFK